MAELYSYLIFMIMMLIKVHDILIDSKSFILELVLYISSLERENSLVKVDPLKHLLKEKAR